MHWDQPKPGRALVLVTYYFGNWPSGIPDAFSGSTSGNAATLTISRAQVQGKAEYYGEVWDIASDETHSDIGRWASETQIPFPVAVTFSSSPKGLRHGTSGPGSQI